MGSITIPLGEARPAGERRGVRASSGIAAALLIAALAAPLPAAAFTARNGMTAVRTGPAEITVIHEVRRGDTDYWCAAGDFVQRELGLPGKTPIWRASPKPRRAGDGIVFTLDPKNAAEGAGLSQFGSGPRDGSIPASMAVGSFCAREFPFWSDP